MQFHFRGYLAQRHHWLERSELESEPTTQNLNGKEHCSTNSRHSVYLLCYVSFTHIKLYICVGNKSSEVTYPLTHLPPEMSRRLRFWQFSWNLGSMWQCCSCGQPKTEFLQIFSTQPSDFEKMSITNYVCLFLGLNELKSAFHENENLNHS